MGVRVGIDLGGPKIEAIALDPRGRQLARTRVPTPRGVCRGGPKLEAFALGPRGRQRARTRVPPPRGDYRAPLAAITGLVDAIEAAHGGATVGVGIPGAPSLVTRKIKNSNSTWLIGEPL